MTVEPAIRRCVIYTRKSTAIGLEQDFNSLDAQREACEAFIKSQAHQGWTLADTFEDGGFTGASMERPGFRTLLKSVEKGRVDVVVVYKVDRLSRSLFDFVKVMEQFNAREVAFVSVTQNFSTADAMGRLTLNMLMSFAEFERAMIIERTRDKIAAARRKGKWTGGNVPFGYDVRSKRLVVNEAEATIVRELFWKYLIGTSALKLAADMNGLKQDPSRLVRPSRHPWAQARILGMLRNRIYLGEVHSHGTYYPGEHAALVDREVFEAVQSLLARQNRRDKAPYIQMSRASKEYLLRGLLRCAHCGHLMTTASVRRGHESHRYYRCLTRNTRGKDACPTRQIPAEGLESFVVDQVRSALKGGTLTQAQADARLVLAEHRLISTREVLASLLEERNASQAPSLRVTDLRREAEDLLSEAAEWRWLSQLLGRFDDLWEGLNPDNRHKLLGLVVREVKIDELANRLQVRFVDLEACG